MFMLKGARGFIAAGTQTKEFLIKHGVNKENIFLSPDTVDTEFLLHDSIKLEKEKEMLKKRLNLNFEKLIVYVGQLIKRKGIIHLLQAYQRIFSDFNSIGLLIIGEGVQEEELKRYCHDHHLQNVFFLGYKSRETLIQYMVISNLLVLPTLADVWGLVINEAMACGLPIVTTKQAGASTDLVYDDKNGYVVDAGDIDGLTIAIKQILQNPEKEQQMKIASREIIKNWGINEAVEGFLEAIRYTLYGGNR